MKYWHFSGPVLRDGSPLPAVGESLPWIEDIHPCERGYHASARPLDAIRYAPGPWVARVRLHGETIEHGSPVDKLVAQSRECVTAYVDASDVLREFSMWSALQVIDLWDAPDVVQRYLAGGGESIGAAWVARAAVRAAAEAAAWAAEDAAAWAAARDAASAAAEAAAWGAAWAAAFRAAHATAFHATRDAAFHATRDAQNNQLAKLLREKK